MAEGMTIGLFVSLAVAKSAEKMLHLSHRRQRKYHGKETKRKSS